jgi:CBS domain containing-hemolysin-like protein
MTALKLLAVILLVLGNGFFVAAEFALVAVRRSRIEQLIAEKKRGAIPVLRAIKNLDLYLAATQLGITFTSLALGWIGEPALAHLIEPLFHFLPEHWVAVSAHGVAIAIAFFIITALHIVLGELAPKSLALQRAEGVSLLVVRPLEAFLIIFRPLIFLLNATGNLLLRCFGLHAAHENPSVHSAEEIRLLIDSSAKTGIIGKTQGGMIRAVFRLADRGVGAVMTQRTEIAWLDLNTPAAQYREKILAHKFSRIPVGDASLDNIVGILQKADLFADGVPKTRDALKAILRKPLFIPEPATCLKALELLRDSDQELAMVVDEYGGITGLVTPQDLLDAVTADASLELPETETIRQADGSVLLNAVMPVDALRALLKMPDLGEDENYHTVGGFMFSHFGHLPKVGESFDFRGMKFEVVDMVGHRVVHVKVHGIPVDQPALAQAAHQA